MYLPLSIKTFFLVILIGSFGCAHKFLLSPKDAVTVSDIVKVSGVNLVDKKRKFSVKTNIKNLSDKYLLIRLHDIECYKGNIRGTIQHAFFGAGERYIDFQPYQSKSFNFLCHFSGAKIPLGKNYKFVFTRIFDNPTKEGRLPGKTLAKNVTWNIKYRE